MKTQRKWIYSLILALVFAGCEKEEKKIEKKAIEVVNVKTLAIKPQSFAETLKLYGVVKAKEMAQLISFEAGEVKSISVKEGQWVSEGQNLCDIDSDIQHARYEAARIQKELAEKNLESIKERFGVGSASSMDLHQVEMNLAQAKQGLLSMSKVLRGATCQAPFSGSVAKVHIEKHQNIPAGFPTISLINTAKVKVEFGVPEAEISFFKEGKKLQVVSTFDESIRQEGEINELAGILTQPERNYTATSFLENEKGTWKPGQNVIVNVEGYTDAHAIAIPTSAILPRVGEDEVFIAREGKAVAVKVEGVSSNGKETLVRSDLAEGDQLIVEGQSKVIDGGPVKVLGEVSRD